MWLAGAEGSQRSAQLALPHDGVHLLSTATMPVPVSVTNPVGAGLQAHQLASVETEGPFERLAAAQRQQYEAAAGGGAEAPCSSSSAAQAVPSTSGAALPADAEGSIVVTNLQFAYPGLGELRGAGPGPHGGGGRRACNTMQASPCSTKASKFRESWAARWGLHACNTKRASPGLMRRGASAPSEQAPSPSQLHALNGVHPLLAHTWVRLRLRQPPCRW